MTSARKQLALGVDIGGTKVAAGLLDNEGNILFKARVPMKTSGTASEAMDCVHHAIREVLSNDAATGGSAIGIASPGPLELPAGVVLKTPNIPCWHNFPLGDAVKRTYGLPTRVDNDANAAGLAEAVWGAGRGHRYVFYVTIGTGIGTAIVSDGQIFYGRTGVAPEGGHMTIDVHGERLCGCGKRGCLESLASGPAIARRAREVLPTAAKTSELYGLCGGDPERLTTELVAQAWRAGDRLATEILRGNADLLAVWLGNIIDLLEPDVIVVGGGVGKVISEWFDYIRKQLPSCSINSRCLEIPLVLAKYGSDAGIAGAAALCFSAPAQIRITPTLSVPAS